MTFKVVNGAWDDGETADKTVTLSGYEDEKLKLASGDIPAVGTNPGTGFKAGSWNETPSTATEFENGSTNLIPTPMRRRQPSARQ